LKTSCIEEHDVVFLIKSDLYRYTGSLHYSISRSLLRGEPGFKYSFWMRISRYMKQNRVLRHGFAFLVNRIVSHYTFKYGISIPPETVIGSGFYIGHFGGIVVSPKSKIGKNCNISQGVTIGQTNRGSRKGFPIIGNNVYIGPGAKIIGGVTIGNDVAVGANCVVTKDVPDNAVVVGVPGRVISYDGSRGYINNTDYSITNAPPDYGYS